VGAAGSRGGPIHRRLSASVPYREAVACGTYPRAGVLDPYGDAIKDAVGETTYGGEGCFRLVREDVAEFPLANVQHW